MNRDIQDFFSALSEDFIAGDIDALYGRFAVPTAIYIATQIVVVTCKSEFAAAVELYYGGLIRAGLASTTICLHNVFRPAADKVIAEVSCHYADRTGRVIGVSEATYYFTKTNGSLKIGLLEYARLPLQTDEFQEPILALAV